MTLKLTVILPDPFGFHFLLSDMAMCCPTFLTLFGKPTVQLYCFRQLGVNDPRYCSGVFYFLSWSVNIWHEWSYYTERCIWKKEDFSFFSTFPPPLPDHFSFIFFSCLQPVSLWARWKLNVNHFQPKLLTDAGYCGPRSHQFVFCQTN